MKNLSNAYGHQIPQFTLKQLAGFPEKLPADYSNTGVYIGDTLVSVLPREIAKQRNPKTRRPHRVLACCNQCQVWVPAGRLHQHLRGAHKIQPASGAHLAYASRMDQAQQIAIANGSLSASEFWFSLSPTERYEFVRRQHLLTNTQPMDAGELTELSHKHFGLLPGVVKLAIYEYLKRTALLT